MLIYKIEPPSWENLNRYPYSIIAEHKWGLPGLKCDKCCATWSDIGLEYPDINIPIFEKEKGFKNPWPVNNARYNELVDILKRELKEELLLEPGTDFGPLKGILRGKPFDFIFIGSWTCLVRKPVLGMLKSEGIRGLIPVPTELKKTGKMQSEEYYELSIYPYAELIEEILMVISKGRCELCGRLFPTSMPLPEHPCIINITSIPKDIDIFRGKDWTGAIFVTERFKEVVEKHKLTGAEFKLIEVE